MNVAKVCAKTTLTMPAKEFRNLPSPTGKSRLGVFYCQASSLPEELLEWREVNPREVNRKSGVFRGILQTLTDQPDRFHERNRGLTIVVSEINFDERKKEVSLTFENRAHHGVVDGAHTLTAIVENNANESNGCSPAYVFVKAFSGVDADQIPEIAGGLNTSQQVDLKSLENLKDHFDSLKKVLSGEPYAEKIAYRMNESKPIDVRDVLYHLAIFDCSLYSDKLHPVALFGRKEGIIRRFAEQATPGSTDDSFRILISKAPEILKLRDMLEEKILSLKAVGRFKAGKKQRIRSDSNRENILYFLDKTVNGKIPLGWMMPMLAGFRANVMWPKSKSTFSWIVPNEDLVDKCAEELFSAIKDVHEQEDSRPEHVGRNALAWKLCYQAVTIAISGMTRK